MSNKQYEGSTPSVGGAKVGNKPSCGTAPVSVRKASITPTPSDKGNYGRGKG